MESVNTIVVGGSQSGLAMSYWLSHFGQEHLVLEKDRVGEAWRSGRWDSFTLVTPNWTVQLPGFPYAGDDPDGFMTRQEIVQYLEDYARHIQAPIRLGVEVQSVAQLDDGRGFLVHTNQGDFQAQHVIIATGAFQKPKEHPVSQMLASDLHQIHSGQYRSAEQLPPGAVLVVGSGQSGCQIADDLHQHGRQVYLSTGAAGRVPRRYRGQDIFRWIVKLGRLDETPDMLDSPDERFDANPQLSGSGGGKTLNLHQFARDGMTLLGRLEGGQGWELSFAPNLKENLTKMDQMDAGVRKRIDDYILEHGIDAPAEEDADLTNGYDVEAIPRLDVRQAGISTLIWACGYCCDYSWIQFPIFDEKGYPLHQKGKTSVPGLYFLGLQYQTRLKSSLLAGVGEDARLIAEDIAEEEDGPQPAATPPGAA